MPLLDHFHPPLNRQRSWESFHSNWATRLADAINAQLPPDFFAEEQCRYPETYRVNVLRSTSRGPVLVSELDLITPTTKDPANPRVSSFVGERVDSLRTGVGVVIVVIVTSGGGNLHDEISGRFTTDPAALFAEDTSLYAVAYRTRSEGSRTKLESWPHRLTLGGLLPTLPLCIAHDAFVPVDSEATYSEACRRRRII